MVLTAAIDGLKGAVFGLTSKAGELVQLGDKFTRASASLGRDLGGTLSEFEGSINSLRGSLDQRFGANLLALDAGLQGTTKGVTKLINQQQLTDGNFKRTATALAQMESALGLSREETNNLAEGLIDTGSRFEISTDKLVDAVAALSDTFPVQALAGMGDNVMGAVTQLQAELGPQLSKSLTPMMKMVLDPSQEAYDKLVRLGIGDMRERLMASKSEAEALAIIKEASITASKSFKQLADGPFYNIGIATENFGRAAIHFTTIADNLGKRQEKEAAATDLYAETISNLYKEIFVPLEKAFIKFHPVFVEITKVFSEVAKSLAREIEIFVDTIRGTDGFAAAVDGMKLKVLDIGIFFAEGLSNILGTSEEGFNKIFGVGGIFDKVQNTLAKFNLFLIDAGLVDDPGGFLQERAIRDAVETEMRIHQRQLARYVSTGDMRDNPMTMTRDLSEFLRTEEGRDMRSQVRREAMRLQKIEDALSREDAPIVKKLKEQRDAMEAQNILNAFDRLSRDEEVEAANETAENTRRIAEIADEERRTRSTFLDETAAVLGASMDAILFGGGSLATQLIVQAIDEQTEVIGSQGGQPTSNFHADQGS